MSVVYEFCGRQGWSEDFRRLLFGNVSTLVLATVNLWCFIDHLVVPAVLKNNAVVISSAMYYTTTFPHCSFSHLTVYYLSFIFHHCK